jgi:hypothetical protein
MEIDLDNLVLTVWMKLERLTMRIKKRRRLLPTTTAATPARSDKKHRKTGAFFNAERLQLRRL